ncbi:MAG: PHP domain-containing protein [Lachnospiraceae bacterium]|nr:PHP domain-containing protein [Lachnospiraceae bacterium]
MKYPEKIDLHLHTNVSDGTDTPKELLQAVRDFGLDLFSVTDHDAIKSSRDILKLLEKDDPWFITGVEFSCRDEEGQYHILGYGYDPDGASICRLVDKGHAFRMNKVKARLDFITSEFGFRFSEEDIRELFAQDIPESLILRT